MRIADPGHRYILSVFDGGDVQNLVFMKREGEGYPFNRGANGGTNCQEVIRALIDRTKYLDCQVPAPENEIILAGLRSALLAFEMRAARRHGIDLPIYKMDVEHVPVDSATGHMFEPSTDKNPETAE